MANRFETFGKIEDMEGMKIRLVDLDKDYETLSQWFSGYGQIPPLKSELGKTMFMIDDLAAIGILRTETSYTFLEPLVGNPKADPKKRAQAVDILIATAKAFCREIGREHVYVVTNNPAVIERKNKFNFEEVRKTTTFRSKL
jgi:hypothetical protein